MTNITTEAPASSAQSYTDIRAKWKALAADRKITKEDISALCIYRALLRDEDIEGAQIRLRKSFSPITNSIKLENGAKAYYQLNLSLQRIRSSTLYSWLTGEEQGRLIKIVIDMHIAGEFE